MKKYLLLFVAAVLVLNPFSNVASIVSAAEADDYEWMDDSENNGSVVITKYVGSEKDITIPEELEGKPVSSFNMHAFQDKGLETVTIPNSFENVSQDGFIDNNLKAVKILNKDIEFWGDPFAGNQSNSEDLWLYGYYGSTTESFAADHGYTFFTIEKLIVDVSSPDPVEADFGTDVGDLHLPDQVQVNTSTQGGTQSAMVDVDWDISNYDPLVEGTQTFDGELQVTGNVINPDGFTTEVDVVVGDSDFVTEDNADGVTITDYIGDETDLVIPGTINGKSVTEIGVNSFEGNELMSINIPDSVEKVGGEAFISNDITSVSLSKNISFVGEAAFSGNPLEEITVDSENKEYFDIDGKGLYEKEDSDLNLVQGTNSGEIEEGTTVIKGGAFYERGLNGDITIPDSVEYIEFSAFRNNNVMHSRHENDIPRVEIPSSVKEINSLAFSNVNIEELILHDGLEVIGVNAFSKNALTSVEVPSSVERIYFDAFYDNEIERAVIKGADTEIEADVFVGNQDDSEDLTILGHPNSNADDYADIYGHTFKPFSQIVVDENVPYNVQPNELIEVLNDEEEKVASIVIPDFTEEDALSSAHLLVNSVGSVQATGLEAAGEVFDFKFVSAEHNIDEPDEELIEVEGDFELALRVDNDAPSDIAMYHEEGQDDWADIGGTVENGFITATATDFSVYGVFAEDEPEVIEVELDEPTFTEATCDNMDVTIELPEHEGVNYDIVGDPREGETITIIATVEDGYELVVTGDWEVEGDDAAYEHTFDTLDCEEPDPDPEVIEVELEEPTFTEATCENPDVGIEFPSQSGVAFDVDGSAEEGETITIIAQAEDGYELVATDGWEINDGVGFYEHTFEEIGDCEENPDPEVIEVVLDEPTITEATCDNPEVGIELPEHEGVSFEIEGLEEAGEHIRIVATVDDGYKLLSADGWIIDDEAGYYLHEFEELDCEEPEPDPDETVVELEIPTFLVPTCDVPEGDYIMPEKDGVTIERVEASPGFDVKLVATPDDDVVLVRAEGSLWEIEDNVGYYETFFVEELEDCDEETEVELEAPAFTEARCDNPEVDIKLPEQDGVEFDVDGSAEAGETVTVIATAEDGYELVATDGWEVDEGIGFYEHTFEALGDCEEGPEPDPEPEPEPDPEDPCESQDPIAAGCEDFDDEDEDTGSGVTIEDDGNKETSSDETGENKLPKTATNSFNLLLAGAVLILVGSIVFFVINRRKRVM